MVQRDCQQGTGPFEVTLTSAGKEIKQLPPALTDVLGIKSPWGKCLGLNLGYHRQGKHLGGSKPIPTLADKLGHAAGGILVQSIATTRPSWQWPHIPSSLPMQHTTAGSSSAWSFSALQPSLQDCHLPRIIPHPSVQLTRSTQTQDFPFVDLILMFQVNSQSAQITPQHLLLVCL